eukprot:c54131_g1_i1 orf=171-491(+)
MKPAHPRACLEFSKFKSVLQKDMEALKYRFFVGRDRLACSCHHRGTALQLQFTAPPSHSTVPVQQGLNQHPAAMGRQTKPTRMSAATQLNCRFHLQKVNARLSFFP